MVATASVFFRRGLFSPWARHGFILDRTLVPAGGQSGWGTPPAAVRYKGSIFEILYRRYVSRLGQNQSIGVIAHRLCRLIWKILRQGVRYQERGPSVGQPSKQKRAARMIRELRSFGYRVELATSAAPA